MEGRICKLLLHGIDTLQRVYFLGQSSADGIDFQSFAQQREEIRQTKMKEPVPVELGNTSFLTSWSPRRIPRSWNTNS
jgi:hypothetical protein